MIILCQILGIIIGITLILLPMLGLTLYSLVMEEMTAAQKGMAIIGFCLVWFAQFYAALYVWNLIG